MSAEQQPVAADAQPPQQQQQPAEPPQQQGPSRCLVYCRMRPTKPKELTDGAYMLLNMNKGIVSIKDESNYDFDGTFGQDSRQVEIFDTVAKPCLDSALSGFKTAILAYGQTGSGKSHTMQGPPRDPELKGIVPRSAEYIFDEIERRKDTQEITVEVQFVQIYRDHLGDLMSESGNQRVDIHWDAPGGVTLPGCSTHSITNKDEFLDLFEAGFSNRITVATAMNPESSRGHAALVVWISSKSTVPGSIEQKKGKVTFIDLAGYERFSKTGISGSDPVRKDEAKTINASLLSLGHVVTSLSNGEKHIPWRNSKLTRLLQDSIGGRSRTVIMLTVGPSSDHLFETTNTLQFGQRAMAVKVQAKQKVIVDWEKHAKKLEAVLEEKNRRIEELSTQLAGCVAAESELILRQQRDIDALREKHAEDLSRLAEEGADDVRLQTLRQQQNVEVELLYTQQAEERAYEEEQLEKEEDGEGSGSDYDDNNNNNDNDAVTEQQQQQQENGEATPERQNSVDVSSSSPGGIPAIPSLHFSPRGITTNDDGTNKSKDEIINDLKRQVRLYRMKLLVPEKYRGTSEEIEHEVLTSRRHHSQHTSREHEENNNQSPTSAVNLENYVSRVEFEAMKKTLENEIDNRDSLLANQLDLGAFSEMVPKEIREKTVEFVEKEIIPNVKTQNSNNSSSKEAAQAGLYIASLQRRIAELNEKIHHHQNQNNNDTASPTTTTTTQEQQQSAPSDSSSASDELQIKFKSFYEQSQQQLLSSLQDLITESKEQLATSSLEFTSATYSEHNALCHKLADHVQFLQTELDTAKMEMEMALEGQNESLMQAIENSRNEAEAQFKIEKLTWEEDAEEKVRKAVEDAVKSQKESGEDSFLMLQAENTRLRSEISQKESEIENLKSAKDELENQNQLILEESVTLKNQVQEQQHKKPSSDIKSPQSESIKERSSSEQIGTKPQQQQQQQQSLNTARKNEILDDLDSILMPVLKNKNQLLDDITEVLASASECAGYNDGEFDHVPEIPLVSARIGTTNTNFGLTNNNQTAASLDPHASLSNFVNMVQNSRQNFANVQQQQRQPSAGGPDDAGLNDSFATMPGDSDNNNNQQQQQQSKPTGIPSLNLGGLKTNNLTSPPMMSPGPSISVRQQQQNPMMTGRSMVNQNGGSGGGGASLPPNLPKVMMKIIKRLRDSSSESENKWLKCVVALSKISKAVGSMMMIGNNSTAATASSSSRSATGGKQPTTTPAAEIAKTVSDVMNLISSALYQQDDGKSDTASSVGGAKSTRSRGMSEAEQARRSLLKHSANASTMQSVIAGETQVAEQQALQSIILSQKEELARTDEEVVSLAVEVARAKLQLRFEKQLLLALGEEDEDAVRTNVGELDEISSKQREEQQQAANNNNDGRRGELKDELSFYRLKSVMLEQELRHKLAELAKTNQGGSSSSAAPSAASSSTNFSSQSKLTRQVELEQIQKEIHQASASIVTDMDLITSCREAELRVLSARLEACERELSSLKKDQLMFGADGSGTDGTGKLIRSNSLSSSGSNQTGKSRDGGLSSSAEAVFYHILRNLRKENSILHSVIRERGLQLRKYALTLMRHQLLPPSTDVSKLAGDVHSELRLAFAERDEEIYLKEQALNMRSTQVIVLEESLSALIDQLTRNDITPCRANSRFAAELERNKDEIAHKITIKNDAREEVKSKIERVKTELERIEQKMAQHRAETGAETSRTTAGGPVATTAHAAQQSANDQLLLLRLQRDHLSHAKNISEVQLGALESEISILKQSLLSASSTMAIESAIESRDAEENASVMSRLFRRMGGK